MLVDKLPSSCFRNYWKCLLEIGNFFHFQHRDIKCRLEFYPYVVDDSKRYASTLIWSTAIEWNFLPADLIPKRFNLGLLEARMNRYYMGVQAPMSTSSLFFMRCDGGQMLTYY